jgi:hypothetical protein
MLYPEVEARHMNTQANRMQKGLLFIAMMLSFFLFTSLSVFAQEANQDAPVSGFVSERGAQAPAAHRPPNTDTVSYWYGTHYRTPFVLKPGTFEPANIQRNSIEYKHADSWSLGSNFIDVMLAKSNMSEPSSGGGDGATEAYVTIRSGLGLNEITGTRAFQFGPVRNVAVEVGANLQTKNSEFAPSERTLYFGSNFEMKMPRGYFKVGVHLRKEWVHEGTLGKVANYDPNFNIEPSWLIPFSIGKVHLNYSGFADYNTPKGKDTFGTDTASEFLIRSAVAVDIGSLMFRRAQLVELNGGLWYWHNEYGKPSSEPGASQTTPIMGLTIHLNGGRPLGGR